MITIKDVARDAGVSIATVSYAVNGNRRLNRDTAARVRASIERLHYRPNRAARSLITRSTRILGALISDSSNPFFAPIVRGLEDAAAEAGYMVMTANTDERAETARRYVEVFAQHNVDGIVVSPTEGFHEAAVEMAAAGTPVVQVNRYVEDMAADAVVCDNRLGARLAVAHLAEQGHRRIGLVTGASTVSTYAERLNGYREVLAEQGIPFDPALVREVDVGNESGRQATEELLDLAQPPTALFAASGRLSAHAFQVLKARSVAIPGRMAFVGFDETEWSTLVSPEITTVAQPTYEMGRRAASLLLERIAWARVAQDERPPGPPPRLVQIEPQLTIRQSSV
jgi:LacI family transcriptional regulator